METKNIDLKKKALRKEMSRRRNQLTSGEIRQLSRRMFDRLCEHDIYRKSPAVYSYASFRSEADTWDFNRRVLSDGKILALPKVVSKERMQFYRIDSMDQLVRGYMGILEPGPDCRPIGPADLTPASPEFTPSDLASSGLMSPNLASSGLIIVPGLAFDGGFHRLGYGGGFYDRYLDACRFFVSCGAAFDCQLREDLPCEPTDYPLDYIVTETKLLERMDGK